MTPMRRALALAFLAAFAAAGAAHAEKWTKYVEGANGLSWQIDEDYTYRDRASGRIVVMQAVSKGATGPGLPGEADGVGSVVAIDCKTKSLITLGSYKPNQPLDIKANWRADTPKKAEGSDNAALLAMVCAKTSLPVK
jgi:hypothetical protein